MTDDLVTREGLAKAEAAYAESVAQIAASTDAAFYAARTAIQRDYWLAMSAAETRRYEARMAAYTAAIG